MILSYDSSNSGCKYLNTMNTMITLYPPTLSPNILYKLDFFGVAKIFVLIHLYTVNHYKRESMNFVIKKEYLFRLIIG